MTLTDLVSKAHCLLIDFDGPICSVFAGYPAAAVADELRAVIRRRLASELPDSVAELSSDPLQILLEVAAMGDVSLTQHVADVCRDAEVAAVASARPTPYAEAVLHLARPSGRSVVVVSNNASSAIDAYLQRHNLTGCVDGVAARFDGMDPRHLKPHPFLLQRGLATVEAHPAGALFIGDSVTDIEAGSAATIPTIGYANKPGKLQRLTDVGADLVVDSMQHLADALTQATVRPGR